MEFTIQENTQFILFSHKINVQKKQSYITGIIRTGIQFVL